MVAFIMQEAAEKSREIHVKADEEFNIEKAKLVHQETATIEAQFARKLRQAEVKRRIARLQVLQARDQVLDEVFEETKKHLKDAASGPSYQKLLDEIVLQCLFRLASDKVTVMCRQQDEALVEKAIMNATKEYSKATGTRCAVSMDSQHLGDCAGGVIATSLGGKVKCDNTLETRLEQTFELMLPDLRVRLFGPSPNRKFFD
ncbi:ATPase, V1/A1 complex, subunit E domain-containing protein [Paramicrosporidium saccamoebae]|uniref:ATPase, V1/A1 complex, subunit E domain-containing protein n=1 Tax=Paramicrosporidium saccamoebae TaxID=1246581 RepID=A0A2H9TP29_9FUNG|nr:ATPase, V1/A1 complex, subunit E domain-containing protein [Paramicrosporidium saccamoebae]